MTMIMLKMYTHKYHCRWIFAIARCRSILIIHTIHVHLCAHIVLRTHLFIAYSTVYCVLIAYSTVYCVLSCLLRTHLFIDYSTVYYILNCLLRTQLFIAYSTVSIFVCKLYCILIWINALITGWKGNH